MRVHVDWKVRELLSQRPNELPCRCRFQQSSHVLDSKDVDAGINQLAGEVQVVVQVVLWPGGVAEIRSVADRSLRNAVRLQNSLDTKQQVVDVVQRIKHPEDVDSRGVRLLHELLHEVIRVGGVSHSIDTTQEHLEGDVWNSLPQLCEPVPRALVEESHGHVERRSSPDLQTHAILECPRGVLRASQQVIGTDSSRQQALMRVPHRGIRQQHPLVAPHALCKLAWALLEEQLPPSALPHLVLELLGNFGDRGRGKSLWVLPHGSGVLRSIHRGVSEVPQHF
mmetsp:Transcript_2496/g.4063  ORF Transcript_2496/g.4063 Transcript_2496/m.4063 type:complete len:281 (-) Transcript_2496:1501-2343(-)